MVSHSSVAARPAATRHQVGVVQALALMALGLFIVGMVGFSPLEAVHNAAHDTRHSNAFPCH
jgi:cobalt transporter subunit CbtB